MPAAARASSAGEFRIEQVFASQRPINAVVKSVELQVDFESVAMASETFDEPGISSPNAPHWC
jgi:acetolactate synthase regulatory subunit